MSYEVAADYPCELGEGPIWHPMDRRVYWTDIPKGRLYWLDPQTRQHGLCDYEGPMVGGMTVQADGSLLLFREGGNIVTWRDGKVGKTITETIPGEEKLRFNDVWADPEGRVFCGTLGYNDENGRFYRLDPDGTLTKILDDVACSNGMGLTADGKGLYYTETFKCIWQFDYDRASGALSNQRVFAKVAEGAGYADGLAVDAEGRVWSARWDGSCVTCIGSDGRDVGKVELPAKQVTSACFAGDDLSLMFVSSAGGNDRLNNGEYAGSLFRVDAGVRGAEEYFSRIGL